MHAPLPPSRPTGSHSAIDPADFPASNQDLLYSDYRTTEEMGTRPPVARALAGQTDSTTGLCVPFTLT